MAAGFSDHVWSLEEKRCWRMRLINRRSAAHTRSARELWLLAYGTVLDYPRRYAATPCLP